MTSYDFAISGQHYLFDVQSFAHTILAAGGDAFSYALLDRTTQGVIDDVASGAAELGVIMQTSETESALNGALAEAGLAFHELAVSAPLVALPSSHPFVNAKSLPSSSWPTSPMCTSIRGRTPPSAFFEEALSQVPRAKKVACTDRASLTRAHHGHQRLHRDERHPRGHHRRHARSPPFRLRPTSSCTWAT